MRRLLAIVAAVVLTLAPAGVGVGVGWATLPGFGVAVGSGLYGLLVCWLLFGDVLPAPREVSR